jgi:hypothetical protein
MSRAGCEGGEEVFSGERLLASVSIIFGIRWGVPVFDNQIALVPPNPEKRKDNPPE